MTEWFVVDKSTREVAAGPFVRASSASWEARRMGRGFRPIDREGLDLFGIDPAADLRSEGWPR